MPARRSSLTLWTGYMTAASAITKFEAFLERISGAWRRLHGQRHCRDEPRPDRGDVGYHIQRRADYEAARKMFDGSIEALPSKSGAAFQTTLPAIDR